MKITFDHMRLFVANERGRRELWQREFQDDRPTTAHEIVVCNELIRMIDWCADHTDEIKQIIERDAKARKRVGNAAHEEA